jgi:murein DD-endopeptidase MepM/ murein hydrolase activator NlpD
MNKRTKIFFVFFIIYCISASAQFHTLLPKDRHAPKDTVETAVDSQGVTKEIMWLRPVNVNSSPEENTRITLDGMRKRQFLALPVDELKINSEYGYRTDPITGKRKFHKGVDLDADFNYIYSIMPGKVIKSGRNRTLGEFIQIEHGEFRTTYGHLLQRLVAAKETVEAGQPIGISGSSGRSTGEHLHFGMTYNGKSIDPMPVLNYILQITEDARNELKKTTINK